MRRSLLALALAMVLPLPSLANEVTVKPGETLSDIAERHSVSMATLMKVNGISDPNHVEAGSRLTIPGGAGGSGSRGGSAGGTVTVGQGETLSEIAERNGMSLKRLMQVNGISNADHVEVGQKLVVASSRPSASASSSPSGYDRGAKQHVVRSGESLSTIADGYGIPMSRLVAINGISDPNHVEAGTRLILKGSPAAPKPRPAAATPTATAPAATPKSAPKSTATPMAKPMAKPAATATAPTSKPKPATSTSITRTAASTAAVTRPATTVATAPKPDWRTYGPLQVDWANWQPMGGSLVAPTLNGEGQSLYLAINCSARKLNATSQAGQWKTWDDPQADFEQKLVTDLCKSRG
jgi:LysM repeat protein